MKVLDKLLIVAACVLAVVAVCLLTMASNPAGWHVFEASFGNGLMRFLGYMAILIGVGCFCALLISVAYLIAHIRRESKVIRPNKHGQAQAIIHRGEVIHLTHADAEAMKLLSHRTTVKEVESTVEPSQPLLPSPSRLPEMVSYEDVRASVPSGHALLGVDEHGQIETCDFEKLMTCWIVGGSSTGKSNTVALKIDEAMHQGRTLKLLVIDPHAKKSDSLYNKIKPYEYAFLRPVAQYEDDIFNALQWFLMEFKRRLDTGDCAYDLLLVVDEVSNVYESENEEIGKLLKKIARICGQESRGFGMFGWFISQKAAGLAWLRNVVITVIAHKMNMMSERKLACNEDMQIARDMDSWPRGRVLVYGLGFDEVRVLQQPIFTVPERDESVSRLEDLQPKSNLPNSATFVTGRLVEDAQEATGRDTDKQITPDAFVLKNTLAEIGKMKAQGMSNDAILKQFGLTPGGRNNQNLKAIVEIMHEVEREA